MMVILSIWNLEWMNDEFREGSLKQKLKRPRQFVIFLVHKTSLVSEKLCKKTSLIEKSLFGLSLWTPPIYVYIANSPIRTNIYMYIAKARSADQQYCGSAQWRTDLLLWGGEGSGSWSFWRRFRGPSRWSPQEWRGWAPKGKERSVRTEKAELAITTSFLRRTLSYNSSHVFVDDLFIAFICSFVVFVVYHFSINVSQLQYVLVMINITKYVLVMIHITMAEWGIAVWWGGLCNDVKVYWSPYACSSLPALSSTIGFLFCQNTASFGKHISACVPRQDSWHKKTASCSGALL